MWRLLFTASKALAQASTTRISHHASNGLIPLASSPFSTLTGPQNGASSLLSHPRLQAISQTITRSIIKFQMEDGKRGTSQEVIDRFYRLNWGGWIRCKAGRSRMLWKKSPPRKRRLRQHVFCNAQQCTLLDKMAGEYYRRPKYFVDDPYEPYHTREEWRTTYTKPRPYFPPEN